MNTLEIRELKDGEFDCVGGGSLGSAAFGSAHRTYNSKADAQLRAATGMYAIDLAWYSGLVLSDLHCQEEIITLKGAPIFGASWQHRRRRLHGDASVASEREMS